MKAGGWHANDELMFHCCSHNILLYSYPIAEFFRAIRYRKKNSQEFEKSDYSAHYNSVENIHTIEFLATLSSCEISRIREFVCSKGTEKGTS